MPVGYASWPPNTYHPSVSTTLWVRANNGLRSSRTTPWNLINPEGWRALPEIANPPRPPGTPSWLLGKDSINEALLGLSLNDRMQANQRPGLPPIMFFSQSSDMVYSASQESNSWRPSRRNVDSLPERSTTTMSSGSNRSISGTDYVARITCTCVDTLRMRPASVSIA